MRLRTVWRESPTGLECARYLSFDDEDTGDGEKGEKSGHVAVRRMRTYLSLAYLYISTDPGARSWQLPFALYVREVEMA